MATRTSKSKANEPNFSWNETIAKLSDLQLAKRNRKTRINVLKRIFDYYIGIGHSIEDIVAYHTKDLSKGLVSVDETNYHFSAPEFYEMYDNYKIQELLGNQNLDSKTLLDYILHSRQTKIVRYPNENILNFQSYEHIILYRGIFISYIWDTRTITRIGDMKLTLQLLKLQDMPTPETRVHDNKHSLQCTPLQFEAIKAQLAMSILD